MLCAFDTTKPMDAYYQWYSIIDDAYAKTKEQPMNATVGFAYL